MKLSVVVKVAHVNAMEMTDLMMLVVLGNHVIELDARAVLADFEYLMKRNSMTVVQIWEQLWCQKCWVVLLM